MKRAFSFRVSPYGWRVFFYCDREQWARCTARNGFGTLKNRRAESEDAGGITSIDVNRMRSYVGVFNGSVGTLAHEATHVASIILKEAGVKVSADNDEALAYLVGYVVDRCAGTLKAAT